MKLIKRKLHSLHRSVVLVQRLLTGHPFRLFSGHRRFFKSSLDHRVHLERVLSALRVKSLGLNQAKRGIVTHAILCLAKPLVKNISPAQIDKIMKNW